MAYLKEVVNYNFYSNDPQKLSIHTFRGSTYVEISETRNDISTQIIIFWVQWEDDLYVRLVYFKAAFKICNVFWNS